MVDSLVNLGVDSRRAVRARNWDMISDVMERNKCQFLEAHDKENLQVDVKTGHPTWGISCNFVVACGGDRLP